MKRKHSKKILKKHGMEFLVVLLVLTIGATVIFPSTVKADDVVRPYGSFPESQQRVAPRAMTVTATAYTSEVWQTDSTPFITASGTTVRHGVIATNFLPIGAKVKIPDYYGDQIFLVEDRMNARYYYRVDIWMEDITEARQFGVRNIDIEIYQ